MLFPLLVLIHLHCEIINFYFTLILFSIFTDIRHNPQLTSSCELEINEQSQNLRINIHLAKSCQREEERVTSSEDIYETAGSSGESNLSYSPFAPRTAEQERKPEESNLNNIFLNNSFINVLLLQN